MKNALEDFRGMCLLLTLQRGDFCCFPFSSCAFPGTRRATEDPRESPRDQDISSETRRFFQGLGVIPGVREILPGSRRFSWGSGGSPRDKEPYPAPLFALLLLSHITPGKAPILPCLPARGSRSDLSHHGILGFTSGICHGRAEPAPWVRVTVFPVSVRF